MTIFLPAMPGASETERLHNDRVTAVEYKLAPGETLAWDSLRPAATIYLDSAVLSRGDDFGLKNVKVERGQAIFSLAGAETIRNDGDSPVDFVRVEFHGSGSGRTWNTSGLAPKSKLLLENIYGRVYEIRIPAGTTGPQPAHHDGVVACLSGAKLRHALPNGQQETAQWEAGDVQWIPAATPVGDNIGGTDFWALAVEPK